jgi:hypothetical protein
VHHHSPGVVGRLLELVEIGGDLRIEVVDVMEERGTDDQRSDDDHRRTSDSRCDYRRMGHSLLLLLLLFFSKKMKAIF